MEANDIKESKLQDKFFEELNNSRSGNGFTNH